MNGFVIEDGVRPIIKIIIVLMDKIDRGIKRGTK